MKTYKTTHMIRPEDLNHHHNLYAGRAIEWMVESSFVAVTLTYGDGDGIRYKNTHKFDFKKSVLPGEIIGFYATVTRTGGSSLTIHVDMKDEKTGEVRAVGCTTFVTVNDAGRPLRHGIKLDDTEDQEELKWRKEAESFF